MSEIRLPERASRFRPDNPSPIASGSSECATNVSHPGRARPPEGTSEDPFLRSRPGATRASLPRVGGREPRELSAQADRPLELRKSLICKELARFRQPTLPAVTVSQIAADFAGGQIPASCRSSQRSFRLGKLEKATAIVRALPIVRLDGHAGGCRWLRCGAMAVERVQPNDGCQQCVRSASAQRLFVAAAVVPWDRASGRPAESGIRVLSSDFSASIPSGGTDLTHEVSPPRDRRHCASAGRSRRYVLLSFAVTATDLPSGRKQAL